MISKVERITRTFSQIQSIDGKIDHENVKPSRSLTTNSDGNNPGPVTRGRPPLPPNGTKPNPYITLSKIQPSSSTSSILSRPADNEIIHDNGFANEDWDDDDDVNMNTERTKENRRSQDLTNPRMNSSASQPVNTVPSSGVRADSNWLKENFDED